METHGTAVLTHEIPASQAVTAVVSREEIAGALRRPEPPELYLDLEFGAERSSIGIAWSHDELEQLLDRTTGDDFLFAFDRDQLQLAFDDVEAHGLRERALVFTVAVVGAIGSGATIANAAPTIGDNAGAASVATVENLAANSIGGVASNVHTPGVQIGPEESTASAASIKLSTEPQPAVVDNGVTSNVHTPGLQVGPGESATSTRSVQASVGSSSSEILGVDTRDVTDALIAGGVLVAIAGATFAGTRRPRSARPA